MDHLCHEIEIIKEQNINPLHIEQKINVNILFIFVLDILIYSCLDTLNKVNKWPLLQKLKVLLSGSPGIPAMVCNLRVHSFQIRPR